jgi:NADH-quinone oxidoreductase subunit E/NADP-reducing hydrogenase subunit HndA
MPNKKTLVPFRGTEEQEKKLREVIARHKGELGATMPVMQEAQDIYGYLPEEVQIMIAEGLGIPLTEVYGISSFYAQFTHNPKGEIQISVCLGTACYVKGSGDVLDRVIKKVGCKAGEITPDGKFSVDATRCVGACGLAPVMIVNGDVYGRLVPENVDAIIDSYLKK